MELPRWFELDDLIESETGGPWIAHFSDFNQCRNGSRPHGAEDLDQSF